MAPVAVRILHPEPGTGAGPLTRRLADARSRVAEHHRRGFLAAGAADVEIVSGPPDDRSFGDRLRRLVERDGAPGGLVVLGSGAIPLATTADRRAFVAVAASDDRTALANNRYSADVVAIARAGSLPAIPDLPGDNALPRWLEEVAGYRVDDLRRRWRLSFDLDGPLDLVLLDRSAPGREARPTRGTRWCVDRLAAVRAIAADRRAELLVAGRTSATTLGWLERHAAARVRAWVEERGLRASSRLAQAGGTRDGDHAATPAARPPPCWGSPSTATARGRWASSWPGSRTPRSSIRACSLRIGSVATRPAGRRPRIGSPRTSCSRTRSRTRGCASSQPPPSRPRSRSCSAVTRSSDRASGLSSMGRPAARDGRDARSEARPAARP